MDTFPKRIADYFLSHEKEITKELLPRTLEELNISFTQEDLDNHYRLLGDLLKRVAKSLLTTNEETSQNEPGYDSFNYFLEKGVKLKETVSILSRFRLSLLRFLRNAQLIQGTELNEGLTVYEEIIYAFDEAIRMTTLNFNERIEQNKVNMEKEMDKISAPVVWINNTHAVLPLVGAFSESRMETVTINTLNQVSKQQVSRLIIDFSGLIHFDNMIAHKLFELIHSVELLGTEAIISGFTPDMARTAVQLGIDLRRLKVYGEIRKAIT